MYKLVILSLRMELTGDWKLKVYLMTTCQIYVHTSFGSCFCSNIGKNLKPYMWDEWIGS